MRVLPRLLALIAMVSPLALMPTNVAADDPIVRMIPCAFPMHHNTTVPAGSTLTLVIGWAMSTRGNLEDFVRAATVTFTINGQAVTPMQSDIAPVSPDQATGEDIWIVRWSYTTTAPAAGQTMVWTTGLTLSRAITDHELQELGLAPPGEPGKIAAGTVWDPNQYFCNITGT
jgi:hypothetical protein